MISFEDKGGRVRDREFLTQSTLLSTLFAFATFASFALIRDYLLCLVSCRRRKGRLFVEAEVLFEMVSRNAYIYLSQPEFYLIGCNSGLCGAFSPLPLDRQAAPPWHAVSIQHIRLLQSKCPSARVLVGTHLLSVGGRHKVLNPCAHTLLTLLTTLT
jgi:hypothetical protein